MHPALRIALCSIAAAGLALGLSACSDATVKAVDKAVDETYEVTYEVTGRNVDSIEFHGGGGTALHPNVTTVQKPTLPWRKTVTLRGIMPSSVVPVALHPVGSEVSCRILYQGKVIAEERGKGLISAGGCVGESPVGG
ncbi:hypothetical protein [Streptomyces sp. NPDC005322]|uniref:hypothetical protein n=1 Tax=Streptomyces sp. NPDC005322 TaxID=3157032 RepID=UPI0033A6C636